ncbi:methionine--tRNA ligase [Candidatus Woesearchaeota archaeon]|nr:methionine--tRNA ligase [Candidatus Woesearchaeota archaeon]
MRLTKTKTFINKIYSLWLMKNKYYVTTAIAYPNGTPHLGHALEIIQADAIARFHKLLGKDVFFQTGTDEHGTKIYQSAKKEKKDTLKFIDENVKIFKNLYEKLNISYDQFIRTTDEKLHHPGAIKLWEELVKSGDIYKKKYSGLYCVGCESFKTEKELDKGKCPEHPTRDIQIIEEENYFFKLSRYKEQIITAIEKDEYKITPEIRKNEILSFLKAAKDISFSRPRSTLPWGIPVPGDPEQVMYVWCDALSNYITGAGYGRAEDRFSKLWPAECHVIGKDILRFHAAFWPAMLLSAGIDLPKELFVHGFVLAKGGAKMSKSEGNVIEPFSQIETFGVDPYRYYLLESMPLGGDGEYSEDLILKRINSEIVGNFSNFCYRILSFTEKNYNSEIKDIDEEKVIKKITPKFEEIKKAYENYDFKKALENILAISALGNSYFQEKEPWKDIESSQEVLGTCINIAKNLSILLQPVMPEACENLQKQLNLKDLTWKDLNFELKNQNIGKPEILFKKIK